MATEVQGNAASGQQETAAAKPKKQRRPKTDAAKTDRTDKPETNVAEPTGNEQKRRRNRSRKPQQNGEVAAQNTAGANVANERKTNGGEQKSSRQPNQQRAKNPRRRPQRTGNKSQGDKVVKPEAKQTVEAGQSTLTKILKSPLKWIKSIGKKDKE